MCDRPATGGVPASRVVSLLRAEQRADELSAAPHADFVEYRLEMVLDGVGADAKLDDDLGGCPSLKNQFGDAALGGSQAVGGEK